VRVIIVTTTFSLHPGALPDEDAGAGQLLPEARRRSVTNASADNATAPAGGGKSTVPRGRTIGGTISLSLQVREKSQNGKIARFQGCSLE